MGIWKLVNYSGGADERPLVDQSGQSVVINLNLITGPTPCREVLQSRNRGVSCVQEFTMEAVTIGEDCPCPF